MFKFLKDRPKILDRISIWKAGVHAATFRGMRMADGSAVTADTIMRTHGVDRTRAEVIAKRQTR